MGGLLQLFLPEFHTPGDPAEHRCPPLPGYHLPNHYMCLQKVQDVFVSSKPLLSPCLPLIMCGKCGVPSAHTAWHTPFLLAPTFIRAPQAREPWRGRIGVAAVPFLH